MLLDLWSSSHDRDHRDGIDAGGAGTLRRASEIVSSEHSCPRVWVSVRYVG